MALYHFFRFILLSSLSNKVNYNNPLIQGNLSPYRQALTEFIFKKLDKSHNNEIDENELYLFIKNSTYPEILSGLVKPR
jgi:hypothetical protein